MPRGLRALKESLQNEEVVRGLYRRAKTEIDGWDILERYGALNVRPMDQNSEVLHSCLIEQVDPHHTHGDVRPSASLNMKKLWYSCWSYGGGDVFWLIQKMEEKETLQEIVPVLRELVGESQGKDPNVFLKELDEILTKPFREVTSHPLYNERVLRGWEGNYHPYLFERNLSEETLEKARVGFDEKLQRIVFPHFWKGQLIGWQKRAVPGQTPPDVDKYGNESTPKYKNSPNFPKLETLYFYDLSDKKSPVLVNEGVISSLSATQYGFNSVASFGAEVGEKQLKALREYPQVVFYVEDDPAGVRKTLSAMENLMKFTDVYCTFGSGGDMNSLPEDEATRVMDEKFPAFLALDELQKFLDSFH